MMMGDRTGRALSIRIVTPAPPRSRYGNRTTARRWARLLRELGHRLTIDREYRGEPCDVLVALHARKSAASVARFAGLHPDRPIILALTGTDLYHDIHVDPEVCRSLELATRLVVLQPLGRDEVPERLRPRVRVVFQSARPTPGGHRPREGRFDVCVGGHLRPVKDPFLAAEASRLLPDTSRLQVSHVGDAMSDDMAARAREEAARNPRYHWLGGMPHWRARRVLARSHAMVISSRSEGGANVVSEALADAVPVIASRIPGNVGILGNGYPGYFAPGDARDLARLLRRAEEEPGFLRELGEWCLRLSPLVDPVSERSSWEKLLYEVLRPGDRGLPVAPMAKVGPDPGVWG